MIAHTQHRNKSIVLRFGKHKGKRINTIPHSYLDWAINNNVLRGKALAEARELLNYPPDTYQVSVEDSLGQDGTYITEAHSKNQAISRVKRKHKVKVSQSGTIFTAAKL